MVYYKKIMKFNIDKTASVFLGTTFTAADHFVVKKNSVINAHCHIDVRGSITIGENVSISDRVSIVTGDHNPADPYFKARFRPVTIHNHVFVGYGATILGNVTIGEGAVIAAGSIITKDVEPYAIVAGIPAQKIGERTRELLRDTPYSRLFH
jgi:maltose O-acetyltransferase